MVDIEAKRAEGKGQGYIHWAKLHNLKKGSKAFKTKDIREGLKACKNEKARRVYREEYDSDFIILDAVKRYFDSKVLT